MRCEQLYLDIGRRVDRAPVSACFVGLDKQCSGLSNPVMPARDKRLPCIPEFRAQEYISNYRRVQIRMQKTQKRDGSGNVSGDLRYGKQCNQICSNQFDTGGEGRSTDFLKVQGGSIGVVYVEFTHRACVQHSLCHLTQERRKACRRDLCPPTRLSSPAQAIEKCDSKRDCRGRKRADGGQERPEVRRPLLPVCRYPHPDNKPHTDAGNKLSRFCALFHIRPPFFGGHPSMLTNHCYQGDCRAVMRDLIAAGVRVQCIVTSPPYWGLRDYGHPGQLGQEPTLREFLTHMVDVFDLCRELLADDGVMFLNMGDSYAGSWGSQGCEYSGVAVSALSARQVAASQRTASGTGKIRDEGIKAKDLMGQPWRLAFALQDAGWWLRQDIIWHKPNPMPESVRDRCTKAHEYLFLMTKAERYYFDADAIKEPATYGATPTGVGFGHGYDKRPKPRAVPAGWDTSSGGGGHGAYHRDGAARNSKRNSFARETKYSSADHGQKAQHRAGREDVDYSETRNKRSVWTIATQSYSGAHFATFPEALVEPCILAGSRPGDIVFDPFMGSGTVASVAQRLGRRWLGAELNPDYIALQAERTRQPGLMLENTA